MKWSTEQLKGIYRFANYHNYKVMMSSSVGLDPKVRFLNEFDKVVETPISEVMKDSNRIKQEEKAEKKRQKLEEERRNQKRRIV